MKRGPRATAPGHTPVPDRVTLGDLQVRVDEWIGQFEEGYWPPLAMLARLTEEVGELAREINHSHGHKPKKASEPPGEVALEVADIVFVLLCLCNSLRIDLGDAFERVMHKYERRDSDRWTRRGAGKKVARAAVTKAVPARSRRPRRPATSPGPSSRRRVARKPA
jgi:NTP pyrophosphatase (non-canonical NTP hydrolase)